MRYLSRFDIDVQAAIVTGGTAVEMVLEGFQRRGLASLPRRVQSEVLRVVDQPEHVLQVDALQGRYAVVILRVHRTGCVEGAHIPEVAVPD